jgi:succinyl-diaminopimelate desuccinylase
LFGHWKLGFGIFREGTFVIIKKRLTKNIRQLLRIDSQNPPGDERAVAAYVAQALKRSGLAPRIFRFKPRRDNVMAVLKGRRSGKGLLVTPHLDTVPAGSGWTQGPFSGTIVNGKVYGRGASDCKGNLAVAMEVFEGLAEDGFVPERDLIFLATADEETGSGLGLIPILKERVVRPAHALILDSDEFYIITAQKGLIHFKVEVEGKRAHGAYPRRGVNAIEQAALMIRELKGLRWRYRPHRLLEPPTVNIGTILGGDKVNMVADRCVFEVDLRFLPGMKVGQILKEVRRVFDRISARYRITVNDAQHPNEI